MHFDQYAADALRSESDRFSPPDLDRLRSVLSDAMRAGARAKALKADAFYAAPPAGADNAPSGRRLIHGILGLIDEAAELAENLLTDLAPCAPARPENLDADVIADRYAEELGDLLWYANLVATAVNWPLSEVAAANLRKLRARYARRFTPEEAAEENRDRRAESRALLRTGPGGDYQRDRNPEDLGL
jgi:NTP pyrophosphatase (non-canonical NTP hydrolase)